MEVIFFLIPVVLVLVGIVIWAFWWAIKSGQFDDMEGPAHRILTDDDERPPDGDAPRIPRHNADSRE